MIKKDLIPQDLKTPHVKILGVRVDHIDMDTTLKAIRHFVSSRSPHYIVTADSSGIVMAQKDEELREIINNADIVTPDSTGCILASKLLGSPLRHRVSGVDIAKQMCRAAAEDGFSVYLLGAKPGVAEKAAQKMQESYPGLIIAGTQDGYFQDDETSAIVDRIKESKADTLLVAFGIPKQEKWIKQYICDTGVCVAIGVGGSFDVLSGNIKRAPVWMQKHGLEWLYRLLKDPSKVSKVALLPHFLIMVFKSKFTNNNSVS